MTTGPSGTRADDLSLDVRRGEAVIAESDPATPSLLT